jgi:hypothetical protein
MVIIKKESAPAVVVLFDLDGVLIRPGGYRAAVEASINHFSDRMGLGKQAPAEEDVSLMEACGITSEWDMVPIFLAILLENISRLRNEPLPDCSLPDLLPRITAMGLSLKRSYRRAILKLARYLDVHLPPAEAVLAAVQSGKTMPHLRGKQFVRELLSNTRSTKDSFTTRIFQTFILGNEGFQANYGIEPDFKSESLLKLNDRCLLNREDQYLLRDMINQQVIKVSVITARPSLPPSFEDGKKNDYSPEGEMALKLTGLENVSLIGYGTMQYLADLVHTSPDSLIKPSPVQALAAIAFPFNQDEKRVLKWSAAFVGLATDEDWMVDLPARIEVHIFEDSPIGIQASQAAAALLNKNKYTVTVKAWGIATNQDKIRALEAVGATVFPEIHGAIQAAFTFEQR